MRFFVLVSLTACAFAALPDAPKVTVSQDVLRRFMVFSDVNQPGQFSNIISIAPSWTSSDPNVKALAAQAKGIAMNIADNYMGMNFLDICRQLTSLYRPLAEGPMAEFAVAHALNAYTRVFNIIQKLDMDIISEFGKLQSIHDRSSAQMLCENNDIVRVAAIQATRDVDVKLACSKFVERTDLFPGILAQGATSHGALHQLNHLLTVDEKATLTDVVNFLKGNLVFPKQFQSLYVHAVMNGFKDYEQFYKQIENSQEVANVIGMPVSQLKDIITPKVTEFFSRIL